ncbi:hypothetical protein Bhyg_13186 [Pseudolycoriella hygida]|uniref:Uncharacterized protein n=1 Tax=Pseudolycoriella hygida TaxID=35572 RepID=A0A9Q0MMW3_9DIPT|nr:hypothetical protein Bhyg_13186 [Pseudolycoriella hygida]
MVLVRNLRKLQMLKRKRSKHIKLCIYGHFLINFLKWPRSRRWAVHPINKGRDKKGELATLIPELEMYPERFEQYFRMSKDRFDFLLNRINWRITGETTNFKRPITPKGKLVVTLRFLASGSSDLALILRFVSGWVRQLFEKSSLKL